ncbi:MAG: hypothetical protein AB7S78_00850 [Candidatus Omnitrophota bacterium]
MVGLVLSVIFGGIGFVGFMYGKKNSEYKQMLLGAGLIVYPYFISNVWWMAGIGTGLTAALFFWRD